MDLNERIKPGCFGAASAYDFNTVICKKCRVNAECDRAVGEVLERIKQSVNVADILMKRRNRDVKEGKVNFQEQVLPTEVPVMRSVKFVEKVKAVLTPEQEALCEALPVNAAKLLDILIRNNRLEKLKAQARAGENPFADMPPRWLAIVFDALIHNGFSRKQLTELFIQRLGWSKSTAKAHVSIAVALLPAIGVAEQNQYDTFVLRKKE